MARSTPAQIAREQRARRRDQLALLTKFISEPAGRSYFYDLLAACHVYSSSFGSNAMAMAFREGERNIGIKIGADLTEASPDFYLQMLKEAENVRSASQRSHDAAVDAAYATSDADEPAGPDNA